MPIIWSKHLGKNGELAVWHINEVDDDLYNKLQLNAAEKSFYDSLHAGKRNMHWLGSRVLLRTLLNTTEYIDCQLDGNNKPYLVNFPYEISISHSNDFAAVIIYKKKAVGVDIEKISNKIERIAKRFLSEKELENISDENRTEQLYACWGIKETLFKLYGKGNLPFIGGIEIDAFDYKKQGFAIARINLPDFKCEYKIEYLKLGEYMLTWCIG
jgi:phosphopantetheine--protein transferase-like protein